MQHGTFERLSPMHMGNIMVLDEIIREFISRNENMKTQ